MNAQYTGNIITEKRKELNLTQKDVAEKLHVSVSAVSKWERGLNFPDLSIMEALCDLLGLSLLELLGIENEPKEEIIRNITNISIEEKNKVGKKINKIIIAIAISVVLGILSTFLASIIAYNIAGSKVGESVLYIIGYICYPFSFAFGLISVVQAVRNSTNKFLFACVVSFVCYILTECISGIFSMAYGVLYNGFSLWEIFSKGSLGFTLTFGIIFINLIAMLLHKKFKS